MFSGGAYRVRERAGCRVPRGLRVGRQLYGLIDSYGEIDAFGNPLLIGSDIRLTHPKEPSATGRRFIQAIQRSLTTKRQHESLGAAFFVTLILIMLRPCPPCSAPHGALTLGPKATIGSACSSLASHASAGRRGRFARCLPSARRRLWALEIPGSTQTNHARPRRARSRGRVSAHPMIQPGRRTIRE